ncbi:S53 family peptidase [Neobacillus drentensis]|uniref:S53 family peptidase n=1 Tax=Neobacillus drentensis TaxID=220684 RepID=UPI002866BBF5|nr:S53 family peptidase [Neobacillus drentensis]MDR7240171.1 subtilase family serine protease [Neobacillus drentensis]
MIRSGITGKNQNIAIVVAFGSPTVEHDLQVFSQQFGLPPAKLKIYYPQGQPTQVDPSWVGETAIDTQWAHALAPDATIHLVVAKDAFASEMFPAVEFATALGVQAVSMSWVFPEASFEGLFDHFFQNPGTVYLAGSGDVGGQTQYPSASPFVVSVGGTMLMLRQNGSRISETGWSGSGGGPSLFEPEPDYQIQFGIQSGGKRATPDVSFNATAFSIFTSTPAFGGATGWVVVDGTSVGTPCWAAIIALADQIRNLPLTDGHQELYNLAKGAQYVRNYNDITVGCAGSFCCTPGYDFVTGLGTPRANLLVRALGRDPDPVDDESEDFEESSSGDESSSSHGHHHPHPPHPHPHEHNHQHHHDRNESSSD